MESIISFAKEHYGFTFVALFIIGILIWAFIEEVYKESQKKYLPLHALEFVFNQYNPPGLRELAPRKGYQICAGLASHIYDVEYFRQKLPQQITEWLQVTPLADKKLDLRLKLENGVVVEGIYSNNKKLQVSKMTDLDKKAVEVLLVRVHTYVGVA